MCGIVNEMEYCNTPPPPANKFIQHFIKLHAANVIQFYTIQTNLISSNSSTLLVL